ncbi:MAG: hypothetical protein IH991_18165, partial [Planctomycetes bacterium]|nr:hypothetical protein [Planctomycetota bacterium]
MLLSGVPSFGFDFIKTGDYVQQYIEDRPAEISTFEVDVKRDITKNVIEPVVDFVHQYNPISSEIASFLTTPIAPLQTILDAAYVHGVLRQTGLLNHYDISNVIRASPAALIFNPTTKKTLGNELGFFLNTSEIAREVDAAIQSDTIAGYDALFEILEEKYGIELPFISQFDAVLNSANSSVLAADEINDLLDRALNSPALEYTLPDLTTQFNLFDHQIPVPALGFALPGIQGGFTVDLKLDVIPSIDLTLMADLSGIYISDNFNVSLIVEGTIGGTVGVKAFSLLDVNLADLTGKLTAKLDVSIASHVDRDGDHRFSATEIIDAVKTSNCLFETNGSIDFNLVATAITGPIGEVHTPLWSSPLTACAESVDVLPNYPEELGKPQENSEIQALNDPEHILDSAATVKVPGSANHANVAQRPDYSIANLTANGPEHPLPSKVFANSSIHVFVSMVNNGANDGDTVSHTRVYASPDAVITGDGNDVLLAEDWFSGITRINQYFEVDLGSAAIQPGTYFLGAIVDATDLVGESDETNNVTVAKDIITIQEIISQQRFQSKRLCACSSSFVAPVCFVELSFKTRCGDHPQPIRIR